MNEDLAFWEFLEIAGKEILNRANRRGKHDDLAIRLYDFGAALLSISREMKSDERNGSP